MTAGPHMRRAEVTEPGHVELRDVARPDPGPGEVLIAVEAALTCGTDLKLVRRGHARIELPTPLGHEFAGTVAAVGRGVRSWREGDAVACVPTAPCGRCRQCTHGRENLCPEAVGRMVLGAFADFVLLPAHIVAIHLFRRPDSVSAVTAAALEPLACVVHGVDRLDLAPGDSVLLIGDGPIALLFVQLLRLRGAGRVMVAGRSPDRLRVAAELGAEATDRTGSDLAELFGESGGPNRVIECVGEPETWALAHGLAALGGRALMFGGCAAGVRASLDTERIHYGEIDVIGAFHYGSTDVREALGLLESDAIRIKPLVTHHRPLSRLHDALALAQSRRAVKVAVTP